MRLSLLIATFTLLLALSACGSTQIEPYEYPEKFADAMSETYDRSQRLDRRIVTQDWEEARQVIFILNNLTRQLNQYIPDRGVNQPQDIKDYQSMVKGLNFTADNLQALIRDRKHAEAIDWMDLYIARFNEISGRFGSGEKLKPSSRPHGVQHGDYRRS